MKKTDYQVKKGSEKIKFIRGVKINDKDTNLTIQLSLNHNKGLYTIQPQLTTSEVTGDDTLDKETCKVVGDLLFEATVYAEEWRKEWLTNQPGGDKNQLPMGFDKDGKEA